MFAVALAVLVFAAPLGSKIKVSGKVYQLTDGVDASMCKAVVAEMVGEVKRHDLTREGEEEVFDTAGMAICLGVVRNYALSLREKSGKWGMRKKTEREKEDEEEGIAGDIEGMLLLKEACFKFADELQQEISEVVYKKVHSEPADVISDEFCPKVTKPKKKKKRRKGKRTTPPVEEPSMMDQYQNFMNEMQGGDGSMFDLIKQDRDTPELSLSEEDQEEIRVAESQLRCEVCKIAVATAYEGSASRRDEAKATEAVQASFFGAASADDMDYTPGNPPAWSQNYVLEKRGKKTNGFRITHSPAKAAALAYPDKIKRNVVVSQACRRAFESESDLGEMIVLHSDWSPDSLSANFCKPVCRNSDDEL